MKKILVLLTSVLLTLMLLASCTVVDTQPEDVVPEKDETVETVETETPAEPEASEEVVDDASAADLEVPEAEAEEKVMTYAEYVAADLETEVVIDAYVQGKQSWWDNKATVYAQDEDGAYFLYEMACSEEDYALLEKGTHIKVKGFKAEWSGEVEIVDATFEIIDGNFVAEAKDATAWLGTDELVLHQNEFVSFKGMTVENVSFKNDEPGDDIYVTFSKDGATYDFCVEYYLTGTETEVYKAVCELAAGDVVDVEGFLYWYEGPNAHITSVKTAE